MIIKIGKKEFYNLSLQFIKFCFVGLSNTIVSMSVYYIVVLINPNWYLAGNIFGFSLGVLNSYFWNSKFVFKDHTDKKRHLLFKSYISYGATLILQIAFLYIMVELLSISKMIAPIINVVLLTPINFILNKYWTYRR